MAKKEIKKGLENIQKKALKIIVTNINSKTKSDITMFSSIDVDSITFITIIVELEKEFDFEFDDEMLLITKFPTVKSMVEYVESKVTTDENNS